MTTDPIVYSISIADIQQVAEEELDRQLSKDELRQVAERIGDYLDWHQAIALAISDLPQEVR